MLLVRSLIGGDMKLSISQCRKHTSDHFPSSRYASFCTGSGLLDRQRHCTVTRMHTKGFPATCGHQGSYFQLPCPDHYLFPYRSPQSRQPDEVFSRPFRLHWTARSTTPCQIPYSLTEKPLLVLDTAGRVRPNPAFKPGPMGLAWRSSDVTRNYRFQPVRDP